MPTATCEQQCPLCLGIVQTECDAITEMEHELANLQAKQVLVDAVQTRNVELEVRNAELEGVLRLLAENANDQVLLIEHVFLEDEICPDCLGSGYACDGSGEFCKCKE